MKFISEDSYVIKVYDQYYEQAVIDLILGIQQQEFGLPLSLTMQQDLLTISSFYQVNKGNFWIALQGDTVIGTIALLDIGNGNGALRKMFVDADWRGRYFGVAIELLNGLLSWACQNSFKKIYLGTTDKFIAAQKFYEKTGFSEIDKYSLPYEFPVMNADRKFYVLHSF